MKKYGTSYEKMKLCDYTKITGNFENDSVEPAVTKLDNIKHLEIQHYNETKNNGVAFSVFESLLRRPGAEAWDPVADDLIGILGYWIDAVRKKLSRELDHWWDFLKRLLKFIQIIVDRHDTLHKLLPLTPSLLDLSCGDTLTPEQCVYVLQCVNVYCCQVNREVRLNFKPTIQDYFPKLGSVITSAAHFPYQLTALECIVRWVVPRAPAELRAAAAYFPGLTDTQRSIFVDAKWGNFLLDARDFLNAINTECGLITSVLCMKISVGDTVLSNNTGKHWWLDVNTFDSSMSVVLEPRALQCLAGLDTYWCEALVIEPTAVTLRSDNQTVTISVKTAQAPRVVPSECKVGATCDVTAVLSCREHVDSLHETLQRIYGEKYQRLLGNHVNVSPRFWSPPSPNVARRTGYSSDSAWFSAAPDVRSQSITPRCGELRLGLINLSRQSSTSSTSLAQLKVKLSRLEHTAFVDNRYRRLIREETPLSNISEKSEEKERSFGEYKVRKAVSDTEGKRRLFNIATGLATPSTSRNIVDLLGKEANINRAAPTNNTTAKKSGIVVSKTTTDDDEYSTDVINDTPACAITSGSKKSFQAKSIQKIHNIEQVCNKNMADEFTENCFDVIEEQEREGDDMVDTRRKGKQTVKEQTFQEKKCANTNKNTNSSAVGQSRPQRNKKPTQKACEAFDDIFPSCEKRDNKGEHQLIIPESQQEDIVQTSALEKSHATDKTTVADQNAKRKRKLYSPKDDQQSFNVSTNNDIERDTPCKKNVVQRQKNILPTAKKAAENTCADNELLSPRTIQRNAQFDKLKATSENEETFKEVVVNKNRKHVVYNYSSDESYNEEFEKKKTRRRNSTSKRQQKKTTQKNIAPKPTATRRTSTRRVQPKKKARNSRSTEIIDDTVFEDFEEIEDERMRTTHNNNALDNSFVITKPNKGHAQLNFRAQIESEPICENKAKAKRNKRTISMDDQREKPNMVNSERRTTRAMSTRAPTPVMSDGTESSLPELVIQKACTENNTSIFEIEDMYDDNRSAVYEPFYDEVINDIQEHIDVMQNEPEGNSTKPTEKTQRTSEAKSKSATKPTGLSNSKRVTQELEPQNSEEDEDGDVAERNINMKDRNAQPKKNNNKTNQNIEESGSGDTENESDKRPADNLVVDEESLEPDIINQTNTANYHKVVPKNVNRRNSSTQTTGSYHIASAVGNAAQKSIPSAARNKASNKPLAKDKNVDDDREVCGSTRKRKAGIDNVHNAKTPRRREDQWSTTAERVPSVRRKTITDKEIVVAIEERSDDFHQQLPRNSTDSDTRPGQFNIVMRKLERMSKRTEWKLSDVTRTLNQLNCEYGEDASEIMESIRNGKDALQARRNSFQTSNEDASEEHNRSLHLFQKRHEASVKIFDVLDRVQGKLNSRVNGQLTYILLSIEQLKQAILENQENYKELLGAWKDDRVPSACSKTRKDNVGTSEEQNDNAEQLLQQKSADPHLRIKLDILIRLQTRTNKRIDWLTTKLLESITQIKYEITEEFADTIEIIQTLQN